MRGGGEQSLKNLQHSLQNLSDRIDPGADQANTKAPNAARKWDPIRWNTYCAALRREGEWKTHNFNADLVRPFTEHVQPDWSGFFDHYSSHTEQFKKDLKKRAETIVEKIISALKGGGAASSSSADVVPLSAEQRERFAKEIAHRMEMLCPLQQFWDREKTKVGWFFWCKQSSSWS